MRWMLGQFQVSPVIGTEKAQGHIAKPIRRGDGPPQDLTGFFFIETPCWAARMRSRFRRSSSNFRTLKLANVDYLAAFSQTLLIC